MVTAEWIRKRQRAIVAIRDLQKLIAVSYGRERPLATKLRNAEIAIYFYEATQRRRERKQHG